MWYWQSGAAGFGNRFGEGKYGGWGLSVRASLQAKSDESKEAEAEKRTNFQAAIETTTGTLASLPAQEKGNNWLKLFAHLVNAMEGVKCNRKIKLGTSH